MGYRENEKRNTNDIHAGKRELELYFHIPFCIRKCHYCDFLSAPADRETIGRYMEALLAETEGSALSYGEYTVPTVFIGGGTPSVAAVEDMERLLAAVGRRYRLEQDAEITMEVNPGTVSKGQLRTLRKAGVNRLSIGLQSAEDRELAAIGRIHTWKQFADTYEQARSAGFENINVDIMSALPGQTLPGYKRTLERILSLEPPPEHISAYSLILEEGTPLFARYEKGELDIPDEDMDREMYQETKRILEENGYRRYEISNYAKPGFPCRHNCGYWRRRNYVGFGLGAASLVENVRFRNGADLQAYLANPLGCREEGQILSRQEQMEEFMFLGLRMTAGVSCEEFRRLFGQDMEEVYGEVIHKNVRDGLLEFSGRLIEDSRESAAERGRPEGREEASDSGHIGGRSASPKCGQDGEEPGCVTYDRAGERLALTERGLDLSNYVMAQFLL